MTTRDLVDCRRCANPLAVGQEYCLTCGLRARGGRFGNVSTSSKARPGQLIALAAIAAIGAAAAIWTSREPGVPPRLIVALGRNLAAPTPDSSKTRQGASEWRRGESGWTIVLADIPKVDGRDAAQAVQAAARRAGVGGAGILDSSQFASLHPGYWVVFAGRYASESEARATLGMARRVSKSARVQRVSA